MTQRVAVGLTLVNAVVLVVLLSQMETLAAQSAPGVLRGSGLEIVDRHGKVRASITIYPETPAAASRPAYPEVVVLRLIDRNGKPMMKLDTREAGAGVPKGAALLLLGGSDDVQARMDAANATARVELKNGDGRRWQANP